MKKVLFNLFGDKYTSVAKSYREKQTLFYSYLHPYNFTLSRYHGTFLENHPSEGYSNTIKASVNRIIYVFWTGDNEITPNRLAAIKSMEDKCGVEIKLITTHNLIDYIKNEDPLPEAYYYLSLNHRSDYLRAYFMYHYGGGYADIKRHSHSWVNAFNALDNSDNFGIGYPEVSCWGAAQSAITQPNLKHDVFVYWRYLIGNCAYIFRPHTIFTAEWYSEAKKRLVENLELLKKHPAKDVFGTNADYPLPWLAMHGSIFHPLCLKYNSGLLKDKSLTPSFKDYR